MVSRRDQPGEHGRLGEIAQRQLARPYPILGFIEEQIDCRDSQPDQANDGKDDENQGRGLKTPVRTSC